VTGLPPAVLLGGDQNAVSAARSLAALGATVHGVGTRDDPLRASRACASFFPVRTGPGLGDRYLAYLEHGPRGAVVLACDDEALELLARNRKRLVDWGYHPMEADDEVLLAMLDKERTYELSRAAGVPTPRTATLRTRADAEQAARSFAYPCALKPLASHRFAQVIGDISTKVYVAADAAELLHWFGVARDLGVEMLVTEIVRGRDESFVSFYTYLLPDGSPLFRLTKHKLRQLPIGFGLTCYQETVWEPEVAELGLRFCQSVGLRGVAAVEFKRDEADGTWKIIECNSRFTLANEIIRLAGVDVPAVAYLRAAGLPVEPIETYRLGVRMWYPIEDALAFLQYRAAGELTLAGWLGSLGHRWHWAMFRLDDPGPTLRRLLLLRLPTLAGGAGRRAGRAARRPRR
jgi:D-aspartate ligase